MTTDATQSDIPQLIEGLRQSRFYGSLEIKLEAGQVVLLKKTETIKPTQFERTGNSLSKQSRGNGKSTD